MRVRCLSALFPIDKTLERWLRNKATEAGILKNWTTRERISHKRIDELLANPFTADKDAVYAKQRYLKLSTLSPWVSGPDTPKMTTPLNELAQKNIKINRAYGETCTNSRASDLQSAAKFFRDAAAANPCNPPKVADGVHMYTAAASAPEQAAIEAAGDRQALVNARAKPLPPGLPREDHGRDPILQRLQPRHGYYLPWPADLPGNRLARGHGGGLHVELRSVLQGHREAK